MTNREADFSLYIKETSRALLGEPSSKRGSEWRYGRHGSLSVDTEKGTWYDHENEIGGGTLDLIIREAHPETVKAAISWLEEKGIKHAETEDQNINRSSRREIKNTYDYVDENGELIYQVVRYSDKSFRQRRPEGSGWSWSVKGVKQIPYRLPDLVSKSEPTVIIVEGEKDADKLASMGLVATCNSGGAGKWPESLTPYFEGRNVVILPDNDDAGKKHANSVAQILRDVATSVRVVDLPGLEEKGDVSDWLYSGGTKEGLISLCKQADPWPQKQIEENTSNNAKQVRSNAPFKALGYNQGRYYYLTRGAEQVEEVKRGSHTSPAEMIGLAPIEWWETHYPKNNNGGVDWHAAASDLMRLCEAKGIFTPDRQRGRGAWYDSGRSVLHLGTRLVVDGDPMPIADHDSWYIYTRQQAMEIGMQQEPATDEQARTVVDIFEHLNWSKGIHSKLAAGWTMLAPICGALAWRPHVWLVAPRGAGKSWVQDHIIGPLLGSSALRVQGSTTEAGIRQAIKQDARPIVFDEAESEDHNSQRRMQTVIELARQASSETSAEIFKGTTGGDGMAFRMRSMFLLGSVNVSLSQAADESRFAVLSLEKPKGDSEDLERFEWFSRYVDRTLSEDFCSTIRSRAYRMMPTIRENAHTLARAVAERVDSQRVGDQMGTLLSGAWALMSQDVLTLERARDWIGGMDFEEAKESEQVSDEENLISTIMQSQVRAESEEGRVVTRSIAELLMIASGKNLSSELTRSSANRSASRHGVCVDGDGNVAVSNTHTELKKILRDTPWSAGWRRVLSRLPGSITSKSTVWFAGSKTRAVIIPFDSAL